MSTPTGATADFRVRKRKKIATVGCIRTNPHASAVWFVSAMGLLDDAIREHLELKRLRGADPGDVAQEERDALGPVRRDGEAEPNGRDDSEAEPSRRAKGLPFHSSESAPNVDSPTSGQETIEINMEAELAAGSDPSHGLDATRPECETPMAHPSHTRATSDESLEWEVPGDHPDEYAEGESDGAESYGNDDQDAAEHVEDVLEETPDFLRDTPEQERLWFEQRPPRDFDFNE